MKPYRPRLVAFMILAEYSFHAGHVLMRSRPRPRPTPRPCQSFDTNFGNTRWFPVVLGAV